MTLAPSSRASRSWWVSALSSASSSSTEGATSASARAGLGGGLGGHRRARPAARPDGGARAAACRAATAAGLGRRSTGRRSPRPSSRRRAPGSAPAGRSRRCRRAAKLSRAPALTMASVSAAVVERGDLGVVAEQRPGVAAQRLTASSTSGHSRRTVTRSTVPPAAGCAAAAPAAGGCAGSRRGRRRRLAVGGGRRARRPAARPGPWRLLGWPRRAGGSARSRGRGLDRSLCRRTAGACLAAGAAAARRSGDVEPPLEPVEPGGEAALGRRRRPGSRTRAQISSSCSRGAVAPRISVRPALTMSAARDSSAAPNWAACWRIRSSWSAGCSPRIAAPRRRGRRR